MWEHTMLPTNHLPTDTSKRAPGPVVIPASQAGGIGINLPRRDGRLSWHRLGTYRDGLPDSRQSPTQIQCSNVVTVSAVEQLYTLIKTNVLSLHHRCDKRLQRLQKILCKRVYYFVHVYLNKKLEEISYSETTVPRFEQREFISDSDSDVDN